MSETNIWYDVNRPEAVEELEELCDVPWYYSRCTVRGNREIYHSSPQKHVDIITVVEGLLNKHQIHPIHEVSQLVICLLTRMLRCVNLKNEIFDKKISRGVTDLLKNNGQYSGNPQWVCKLASPPRARSFRYYYKTKSVKNFGHALQIWMWKLDSS